jgi:hypothetical protein
MSGPILHKIMHHPMAGKVMSGVLQDGFGGVVDPILAMFSGGEAGPYFNLYADNVLFQDIAETIPATETGHPVRVMRSLVNDIKAIAPSDAARVPLNISGGVRWLEPNGVDQRMLALFTITQPWSRVTSVRVPLIGDPPVNRQSGKRLYSGGNTQSGELIINGTASGGFSFFDGATRNFTGQLADNTDGVIFEEHNSPSGSRMATDDGAFTAGGNSGATVPGGWNIGSLFNGSVANSFANFRFYGGFMIDRLLTEDERGVALGQY